MSRITVDAATIARLHNLDEFLILCDESGRTIGYFHPGLPPNLGAGQEIISPVSDEEIARRRRLRRGIPFSEVLKRLEEK